MPGRKGAYVSQLTPTAMQRVVDLLDMLKEPGLPRTEIINIVFSVKLILKSEKVRGRIKPKVKEVKWNLLRS